MYKYEDINDEDIKATPSQVLKCLREAIKFVLGNQIGFQMP